MQFSLRTLLIATTAVAIYVGGSFGVVRTLSVWQGSSAMGMIPYSYLLFGMPTFVLWVVAVVWAYERRERPGMKPLIGGLLLMLAWRVASPLVQAAILQPVLASGSARDVYLTFYTLINALMQTLSWALLLYAFVKASDANAPPVAQPQGASPISPSER